MVGNNVKTRGKRTREHTGKTNSGITPPSKRAVNNGIQRKNTRQTSLSEWLTDDEATFSKINSEMSPPTALPSLSSPPTEISLSQPTELLSPILSQPRGSADRENVPTNSDVNSPISSALNLVASANSLREDFAACQQFMSEKHQFLVCMLDGMDKKVASIGDKLVMLESRVQALEKNGDLYLNNAQCIFQASNKRHNDLEEKIKTCETNIAQTFDKTVKIDELCARVTSIEAYLRNEHSSKQKNADNDENTSLAIYGLEERYENVLDTVNKLLSDMNLGDVNCIAAHRTPNRPDLNRKGVVIAKLGCLADKQEVLKRKRYIRSHPQYVNVYISAYKSHVE